MYKGSNCDQKSRLSEILTERVKSTCTVYSLLSLMFIYKSRENKLRFYTLNLIFCLQLKYLCLSPTLLIQNLCLGILETLQSKQVYI